MIPQLYEDAYNQYMNDYQMKLSGLGALQEDRSADYQEYLDTYNRLQNNLSTLQQQDQTEYERYLNQWEMDRTEQQDAYDKALAQYEMLGYATPEIAQILGINADLSQKQISALQKAMNSMGSNVVVDGILGKQSSNAYQKLGYMDAWTAYQAMVEAGLIDAEGNYIGPETKKNSGGGNGNSDGNGGGAEDYTYLDYLYTQAKSMFENGDMSYSDYNAVMDVLDDRKAGKKDTANIDYFTNNVMSEIVFNSR